MAESKFQQVGQRSFCFMIHILKLRLDFRILEPSRQCRNIGLDLNHRKVAHPACPVSRKVGVIFQSFRSVRKLPRFEPQIDSLCEFRSEASEELFALLVKGQQGNIQFCRNAPDRLRIFPMSVEKRSVFVEATPYDGCGEDWSGIMLAGIPDKPAQFILIFAKWFRNSPARRGREHCRETAWWQWIGIFRNRIAETARLARWNVRNGTGT